MITTITIILLTVSCILLAREVYKLQKKVMNLHNETNTRISEYHIDTTRRFDTDVNELHYLVREMEVEIKSDTKKKLEKLTEQIIKKIPTTNEELLKEIAEVTGGKYFRATDNRKLKAIYKEIDALEKTEVEEFKFYNYEEKFRPLVLLALGLLLFEFLLRFTLFRSFI